LLITTRTKVLPRVRLLSSTTLTHFRARVIRLLRVIDGGGSSGRVSVIGVRDSGGYSGSVVGVSGSGGSCVRGGWTF